MTGALADERGDDAMPEMFEKAYETYCTAVQVAAVAAVGDSNDTEIDALRRALDHADVLIQKYREAARSNGKQVECPAITALINHMGVEGTAYVPAAPTSPEDFYARKEVEALQEHLEEGSYTYTADVLAHGACNTEVNARNWVFCHTHEVAGIF